MGEVFIKDILIRGPASVLVKKQAPLHSPPVLGICLLQVMYRATLPKCLHEYNSCGCQVWLPTHYVMLMIAALCLSVRRLRRHFGMQD